MNTHTHIHTHKHTKFKTHNQIGSTILRRILEELHRDCRASSLPLGSPDATRSQKRQERSNLGRAKEEVSRAQTCTATSGKGSYALTCLSSPPSIPIAHSSSPSQPPVLSSFAAPCHSQQQQQHQQQQQQQLPCPVPPSPDTHMLTFHFSTDGEGFGLTEHHQQEPGNLQELRDALESSSRHTLSALVGELQQQGCSQFLSCTYSPQGKPRLQCVMHVFTLVVVVEANSVQLYI